MFMAAFNSLCKRLCTAFYLLSPFPQLKTLPGRLYFCHRDNFNCPSDASCAYRAVHVPYSTASHARHGCIDANMRSGLLRIPS